MVHKPIYLAATTQISKYFTYLIMIAIPLFAYLYFENDLTAKAAALILQDAEGYQIANYGLIRFILFIIEYALLGVYAQFCVHAFIQNKEKDWRIASIWRRETLLSIAICFLIYLGSLGFIVVVVPPLIHLSIILDLKQMQANALILMLAGPLALWFGHFALRLTLALPIYVERNIVSFRQALRISETKGRQILLAELALIPFLILLFFTHGVIFNIAQVFTFTFALSMISIIYLEVHNL